MAILSGGNIDPMLLLRVIEHGLASAGRFLRLTVRCADRPGELARLLSRDRRAAAPTSWTSSTPGRTRGCSFGEVEVALSVETRGPDHSDGADQAPCADTGPVYSGATADRPDLRAVRRSNLTTVTLMSAPLGAVYVTVWPSPAPRIAWPSADSGL